MGSLPSKLRTSKKISVFFPQDIKYRARQELHCYGVAGHTLTTIALDFIHQYKFYSLFQWGYWRLVSYFSVFHKPRCWSMSSCQVQRRRMPDFTMAQQSLPWQAISTGTTCLYGQKSSKQGLTDNFVACSGTISSTFLFTLNLPVKLYCTVYFVCRFVTVNCATGNMHHSCKQ